jgi:hypothetical protein
MPSGYQAITRAQLRQRLTEFYEGVPFWTADEANTALNENLRFYNALTGRWKTRETLETTPGMRTAFVSAGLTYTTRVAFNGKPLSPTSREDLNLGRRLWYTETTASGYDVPTVVTLWAPRSLQLIDLWPADAAGHNSLLIDGVMATPVLLTDAAFVNLSEADVSALLGQSLHTISLKKGGPWFQTSLKYFKLFLAHAADENQAITTASIYRRVMGLDNQALKPVVSAGVANSTAALAQTFGATPIINTP